MTSFFHDLEDQLRTAAHERVSDSDAPAPAAAHERVSDRDAPAPAPPPRRPRRPGRRGRWGWLAVGARAIPVLAAVAVTIVVLVGALVLLGHHSGQGPTPPASGGPGNAFAALVLNTPRAQLQRELTLMDTATRTTQGSPACRVAQPRTPPDIHHAPGRALLSTIGVLRRPATAADRLPRGAFSDPGGGTAVYAGAARRAARILGTTYYLVPIRQDPAAGVPSGRCFALKIAALDKALPTFPAQLRSPVRKLATALIAYYESLAAKPPVDAVCQVTVQRNGGGENCSETPEQIRHNLFPDNDNGVFSGLVPDGVASVTLSFPATSRRAARSVTATVHGNVYAVKSGLSEQPRPGSPTVTWRAADGHEVRSYTQPSAASLRQLCRQDAEACLPALALEGGQVSHGSGQVSESSSSASATTRSQATPRPAPSGG